MIPTLKAGPAAARSAHTVPPLSSRATMELMARGPDLGGSGALAEQVSSLTPPSPPPPPAERVTPEDVQLAAAMCVIPYIMTVTVTVRAAPSRRLPVAQLEQEPQSFGETSESSSSESSSSSSSSSSETL